MNVAVTGAAGGIGKATVLKLIKNGSQVLAIDLPGANFEYLDSIDCEILFADVSEEVDRNIIVEKSLGFDGLVNAAGKIDTKSVSAYSIEEIRSFFRVNFESIWDLTSRIGASMPKGGSIVNVSSAGAKVITNSNVGPYSATKAAILSLSRTFAFEFAPQEVRVNSVCPGLIDTPMQMMVSQKLADEDNISLEEVLEKRANMIPMKRLGTPEECANVIAFLLSSESSYMTGQSINISGGWVTH
jgi:NAD(P)-dependent dehydrogenase (short-subunit alcohol dehydrogenase family)